MATLDIKAPDGKTLSINVPEGTDPSKYDAIAEEAIGHYSGQSPHSESFQDILKASAKQVVSPLAKAGAMLHPKNLTGLLPMAGMMAGTAVAPGVGTAAGAGLGSIVQRMADLAYGQGAKPPEPGEVFAPKEMIWPAANTALAGIPEVSGVVKAGQQTVGQATSQAVDKAIESSGDWAKKNLPKVLKVLHGKSDVKTARLFKDPLAPLPESLGGSMSVEKASSNYGTALENDKTLIPLENGKGFTRGMTKTEFSPFSRGSKEAEETAQSIWDKWKAGEEINAQEAFDAKRATDKLWPTVIKERNAEQIRQLSEFKTAMDDVLSNQADGPFQQASKDYARARLGADFSQILPRTKTGDISTVKTLLLPMVSKMKTLGLIATSPASTAIGNMAVQGGVKGINAIANNPAARQVLLQVLQRLQQGKK